jgi:hypothetical protein
MSNNSLNHKGAISAPGGLVVFGVVALVLISAGVFTLTQTGSNKNGAAKNSQQTTQQGNGSQMSSPLAPNTLVYGTWTQQGSKVKALDLSNGAYQTLAVLPGEVKKVSVLSPDRLLYINQTDKRDHGKSAALYSIAEKKISATIPADDGFGIDDYVISPNRKYAAFWEVSFAPGSGILYQGQSRVYVVDLANPSEKKLIYDEYASGPVHYPRAITDNGRVFLDTFLPNDPNGGTGWAYGMSISNFDGSQKQELTQMENGTYGTQPVLSPEGTKLVFAGYDGKFGAGDKIKNGYRQALLTPNTVELLDVNTLAREKLANLPNDNTYSSVSWNGSNTQLLLGVINKSASGMHIYDLTTKALQKIATKDATGYVTPLSPQKVLTGTMDNSPSTLGNLGESYSQPYTRLIVSDVAGTEENILPLPDGLVQYIATVPANYFAFDTNQTFAVADSNGDNRFINLYSASDAENNKLQLNTFMLKPDLASVRQHQQSDCPVGGAPELPQAPGVPGAPGGNNGEISDLPPPPPGLPGGENPGPGDANQSGVDQGFPEVPPPPPGLVGIQNAVFEDATGCVPGTNPPEEEPEQKPRCRDLVAAQGIEKGDPEWQKAFANAKKSDECYDSPLYLYGKEGQNVNVRVDTYVYNTEPGYDNGYKVKLLTDGMMRVNGSVTDSIKYDYTPAIKKIDRPTRGTLVRRAQLGNVLTNYGKKIGLNAKEINDLIAYGNDQTSAPYVFVSFFNHEASHEILPLSFTPKPDNYLNIIFYFKEYTTKPTFSPEAPVFPNPLKRTGFTAVEVSGMVE